MPSDRAAAIRLVIALAALSGFSLSLFAAASRDAGRVVVVVRATPTQIQTPAVASIEVRP